ncbi:ferric-dicitrate binding protein FerR (iron transport regulator) [Pedobacter cryoconitis]|uniref:Ferric-dicitrate binding protein FerR (Iron transport regulator) n=1 Tax=Pedobacter cryoconitis TaxID=188932 RepID=A0A7W8ZRX9_9SPHI|nr:FecR family protein [Pedobacter cryoconitis]MBB5638840.1 ferric-dicitrate binding protein FerR (iron transport regulator) [Pedobacter cryoconitis]
MSDYNKQQELKATLKKYLKNETNAQVSKAIDSWYHTIGSINEEAPLLNDPNSKAELGSNIKLYLANQIHHKKRHWLNTTYFKYAATVVFMLSTGILGYSYLHQLKQASKKEIVFFSGAGTQKKLLLPDGSKVLLNVASELVISKDFGETQRKVILHGEAFFEVAKDKSRPFIIQSGVLRTQVVGTSFNINAYSDMDKIKIAVLTGKVRVSKKIAGVEEIIASGMTRGATLSFYKTTGKTELKTEDTGLISSWKDNKLYIDNATISEIARQLEKYYHLKVVFNTRLDQGQRYTIKFNKEPANRVMEILSILTKRKFTYQTNQITIK